MKELIFVIALLACYQIFSADIYRGISTVVLFSALLFSGSYFAFETKEKATAFEAYLKTGSGHAFAKRHF